jgi:hypothetical protein
MVGGETPFLLSRLWTLDLIVAGEKDIVNDGKIKKKMVVGGG